MGRVLGRGILQSEEWVLVKWSNIIPLEVNINIFLNMALTQDSYFVSFETVKIYNWIVKYLLSDFNCYWRIAL